jgi:hypothetical protein
MRTCLKRFAVLAATVWLGGCTYPALDSVEAHFITFQTPPPKGATVYVCHAYGCQMKTRFRFTDDDVAQLGAVMAKWRTKAATAEEERRGVAYAIGWMKERVGKVVGTITDRAGDDFLGNGDPTQEDCVDTANNATSYLSVLAHVGLLKHHTVGVPFSRENYLRGVAGWTHWTAVLVEKPNGQKWAVDSWIFACCENPAIVRAEEWYTSDINNLAPPSR